MIDARVARLNSYVTATVADAFDRLADPSVEELVARCLSDGVRTTDGRVRAHLDPPHWVSDRTAAAVVSWAIARPGRDVAGEARLSLLAVQTGTDPITELVVSFDVPADPSAALPAKEIARATLDALASRLSDDG